MLCYIQKIAYLCNVIKRETDFSDMVTLLFDVLKTTCRKRVTKVGKECE